MRSQSRCSTERWRVGQHYCLTEHHELPVEYLKQPERVGRQQEGSTCSRYTDWRPNLLHQIKWASSLVAVASDLPLPPALRLVELFSLVGTEVDTHMHAASLLARTHTDTLHTWTHWTTSTIYIIQSKLLKWSGYCYSANVTTCLLDKIHVRRDTQTHNQ